MAAFLSLLILSGAAWSQETPEGRSSREAEAGRPANDVFGTSLHGSTSLKYRFRWAGDENDQDLYESLTAEVGDPKLDALSGHFLFRASEDVDGDVGHQGYYPYDGIADTYDETVQAQVYYAYVDFHKGGPLQTVRLGRQWLDETPTLLYMDGLRVETAECAQPGSFQAGAYGGIPVHPFESSPKGDRVAGAFLQGRPWPGARARADYSRIRDESPAGVQENDLVGLGFVQNVGPWGLLRVQHNLLDGESRDFSAQAQGRFAGADLQVLATYTELLQTQELLAVDLDSFFLAGQETFPYRQGRLVVTKGIGEHVSVQAGADERDLKRSSQNAPLNREFRRYYVTPTLSGWPAEGASLSLTMEVWDVIDSKNGDIATGGADLSYRWSKALRASLGSSYALYKYDYFLAEEREHVRIYYAKIAWKMSAEQKIEVSFEYEDDDLDTFATLKVGVSQSF